MIVFRKLGITIGVIATTIILFACSSSKRTVEPVKDYKFTYDTDNYDVAVEYPEPPGWAVASAKIGWCFGSAIVNVSLVAAVIEIVVDGFQDRKKLFYTGSKAAILGFITKTLKKKGYKKLSVVVDTGDCLWEFIESYRD